MTPEAFVREFQRRTGLTADGIVGPLTLAALDRELRPVEQSDFDKAVAAVLEFEGGYVDHPSDPSGATNLGITHKTLSAWRGGPVTKADVKALTREEAAQIYLKNYWRASGADSAPWPFNLMLFDTAVNQGVSRAVKWSQQVLGVGADGIVGQITRQALAVASKESALDLAAKREAHYRSLPTFGTFGKGWMRRLNHMREIVSA